MRSRCASAFTAITAGLVAGLTLVACGPSLTRAADREGPEPAVLRTYQVAPERQDEIYNALRFALGANSDDAYGRVSRGPGGTLVVVAPDRIQAGVQGIVDADFEEVPSSDGASGRSIRLTYSIVVGRPLDSAAQPVTVRGRPVARLDEVFAQIAAVYGPTEFVVLEELVVTSTDPATAQANGRTASISQQASRRGGQIVADLRLSLGVRNLYNTQVMLRDGQILVLGQAGYQGADREVFPDAGASERSATLYYIVSSDPA